MEGGLGDVDPAGDKSVEAASPAAGAPPQGQQESEVSQPAGAKQQPQDRSQQKVLHDALEAARAESHLQAQRLAEARAQLQAIAEWIETGRPQREALRLSAFARMQARLESLPVIEQAKGVVMAQQRCGPDEAFDLLRRASQRANVKLHVLAEQIVAHVSSPTSPADTGADVRQSTSAG